MIRDQNDPTGMGLFSRCARNQACKITTRPQTANARTTRQNENHSSQNPALSMTIRDEVQVNSKRKGSLENSHKKTSKASLQAKYHLSESKNNHNIVESSKYLSSSLNNKCLSSFSREESRQQRERKYVKDSANTPSVGQYNPTKLIQKPKLVWDVLKLYQKGLKNQKKREEISLKMAKQQKLKGVPLQFPVQPLTTNNIENNGVSLQSNDRSSTKLMQKNENNGQRQSYHQLDEKKKVIQWQQSQQLNSTPKPRQYFTINHPQHKKSRCMVNMSRTTGRTANQKNDTQINQTIKSAIWGSEHYDYSTTAAVKNQGRQGQRIQAVTVDDEPQKKVQTQPKSFQQARSHQRPQTASVKNHRPSSRVSPSKHGYGQKLSSEVDLNRSMDQVKSKLTKNVLFKKMTGRKDNGGGGKLSIGGGTIYYDCSNLDLIKKKSPNQVGFGVLQGRRPLTAASGSKSGSGGTLFNASGDGYSYMHYDYDEYVWKNKSTVYPNTKKGLIRFENQGSKGLNRGA